METTLKPGMGMLLGGVALLAVGAGLTVLLQNSSAGLIAVILVAVGAGIALRGLFALSVGNGPGAGLIRAGWGLVIAGLILMILFPFIGGPATLIGGVAVIGGHVVRGRHSGDV